MCRKVKRPPTEAMKGYGKRMRLTRKHSAVTSASARKSARELVNKLSVNKYSSILRKSNVGEEQAVAVGPTSGKCTLKRSRKSSERIYQSNLVPEAGGLEIDGVTDVSPRDADARVCWYYRSTDGRALKSEVACKLTPRTGKTKTHCSIVGPIQKCWRCRQRCEHQLRPSCQTFPLTRLRKAEGRQPPFPVPGWLCKAGSEQTLWGFGEGFSPIRKFDPKADSGKTLQMPRCHL